MQSVHAGAGMGVESGQGVGATSRGRSVPACSCTCACGCKSNYQVQRLSVGRSCWQCPAAAAAAAAAPAAEVQGCRSTATGVAAAEMWCKAAAAQMRMPRDASRRITLA